jgi:TPR repeat protein
MKHGIDRVLLALLIIGGLSSPAAATHLEDGKDAFEAGKYTAAMEAFSAGFRQGDPTAGYYLARMFALGLGVAQDPVAAMRLYMQAAEGGDAKALNRVALMHMRGESGVVQDYGLAADNFRRAAAQGDRNALYNLGKLFADGKGTPKNPGRAIDYYKQAAEQDHILALNTLGALYRLGAKSAADRALARAYFARSAAFGNAVGLFETARMILEEGSEAKDRIAAHMHLNLATARAHPNAPAALQALTVAMSPEEVMAAQEQARAFEALPATVD